MEKNSSIRESEILILKRLKPTGHLDGLVSISFALHLILNRYFDVINQFTERRNTLGHGASAEGRR